MAGSFNHCSETDEDGDLTGGDDFTFDLIENMGDAHEACSEMHWLVWYLAGGDVEIIKEAIEEYHRRARERL
jgi:hypothetical protein